MDKLFYEWMTEVELPTFQSVSEDESNISSDDDDGNGGFDSVGTQSSDDDDADQLYFNFVQHFRKGILWRS